MSFKTDELERPKMLAHKRWGADTYVLPRSLADQNLYEGFRDDVLDYFSRHNVKWWSRTRSIESRANSLPTGHLNSSQVACVNHLEPARRDASFALAIAKKIDGDFVKAVPVEDDGFVAYEWIGARNYLGESGPRARGANITSLDAIMLARRANGENCLLVFEWKYLESYDSMSVRTSKAGTDRMATYAPLLAAPACPIAVEDPAWLFYDPYYQLMRQTLLAWQMTAASELGATEWVHVNVVPEGNLALRTRVRGCAPNLVGTTMEDAWRSVLKQPLRFRLMSPTDVTPVATTQKWQAWRTWIRDRYLT